MVIHRTAAKDVASGITLGCVLLGQSLAHAALCGVSVVPLRSTVLDL